MWGTPGAIRDRVSANTDRWDRDRHCDLHPLWGLVCQRLRGGARQEAERLLQEPETEARLEAERLANQLQMRLESMRYGESRRSPLDYQSSDDSFLSDCDNELLSMPPSHDAYALEWRRNNANRS